MAGPFSFLPLSSTPVLKALMSSKENDSPQQEAPPEPLTTDGDAKMDKDNPWYDGSPEDPRPAEKRKFIDTYAPYSHAEPLTVEEEEELLACMPPLFGTDLPPCNADVQIAYELVIDRLRKRWMAHRGRLSPIDICLTVNIDIEQQNRICPPGSGKGPKKPGRTPWCRESVFKFQLRWIKYFISEAQALYHQKLELMTESELIDDKKQYRVPPELMFNVTRRDILESWDKWNAKKRATPPVVPGAGGAFSMQSWLGTGRPVGDPAVEDGQAKRPKNSSEQTVIHGHVEGSEEVITPSELTTPTGIDPSIESHMWSHSGHD